MERREYKGENEIQSIEDAVERLMRTTEPEELKPVVSFLQKNKNDVSEFCLQVKDRYSKDDSASIALELGRVIEALL